MRNNNFRKGLVAGVICLFLGVSIFPSISGTIQSVTDGEFVLDMSADQRAWPRYKYDMSGTSYYPIPAATVISDDPFIEKWNALKQSYSGDTYWRGPFTGDVNGDGKLEIVYGYTPVFNVGKLFVLDYTGKELWNKTILTNSYSSLTIFRIDMLADVTGDDALEIFVYKKPSSGVGEILIFDGYGNLLKTLSRNVAHDGQISAYAVVDQNDDGVSDIIINVESNYGANPRGVSLFNFASGNEIWYYASGKPFAHSFDDIDGDGQVEMTGRWASVHNGAYGSGLGGNTTTTDGDVWSVVINENGWEIFSKKWTDYNHHGVVFDLFVDLDRDGVKEILTLHGHQSVYPGTADVNLLNASNGVILRQWIGPYNVKYSSWAVADINDDGKDEVLVSHTDKTLRVLDSDLNLVNSKLYSSDVRIHAVNDLNGDGDLEIIVSTGSILRILTNELIELWSYSFPQDCQHVIISDLNEDGINELIVGSDKLYVLGVSNQPPIANANGPYWNDDCTYSINFDGSGSYDPDGDTLTYDWDFGDGTAHGTGVNPTHTYTYLGEYAIILTVDDGELTDTDTSTATIYGATADAGGPYFIHNTERTVNFDGTGSSGYLQPLTYDWDFGDGSGWHYDIGPTPTYTYPIATTYEVQLKVTEPGNCCYDIDTTIVNVTATEPPIIQLGYPTGGEILNGMVTVQWYAIDEDHPQGENLRIYLYYSCNNGAAWMQLGGIHYNNVDYDRGSYQWGISNLASGSYILKVEAVDKYECVAVDDSEPFTIDNGYTGSRVSDVQILDTTINSAQWVKNGDTIEISAVIAGGSITLQRQDITADLSGFGLGNMVVADSYDGSIASWKLYNVQCTPLNGAVIVRVTVEELHSNTGTIIADNTNPALSIDKPGPGIYFFNSRLLPVQKTIIIGGIDIELETTESNGIQKAEFYIDNYLEKTVSNEPFEWYWNSRMKGQHQIQVKVYDMAGNIATQTVDILKLF